MRVRRQDQRITTPEEEAIELHPDSWERFEQTVGKVVKGPPAHRAVPKKSAAANRLDLDNIRRIEDCGAAAVVLPSIFEEQIEAEAMEIERLTTAPSESFAEALSYFPAAISNLGEPRQYLEIIRRAREAVAIPVIASLNGISPSGWRDYARLVEQAGASAIELNAYFIPSDLRLSGSQVEDAYLDTLTAVKAAISIPVALKLSPYFSALGHVIRALDAAGADGFTLFNRFYQP
jgi:dihydroorotate dehydrogenase (fumarate)